MPFRPTLKSSRKEHLMPMLKLIKEVLRVGNATVPYPFVKVDVSPGFRGKPE